MNKYNCSCCGNDFESDKPFMCGLEYFRDFSDGEFVPDVLVYLCEDCRKAAENERNA